MSIKSIKITNVMAFQNRRETNTENPICAAFELAFSNGINVIIGENGSGKTTLLKMIYAATQWSHEHTDRRKTYRFHEFFSNNLDENALIKANIRQGEFCGFEISDGTHNFIYNALHDDILSSDGWLGLNLQSVFIPTTEMLSHSKGFLALNEKFRMPFDETQIDIIVNASLPEARTLPPYMDSMLEQISNAIDGTVIHEDDTFYVVKKDGRKINFSLEAEGLRKLALLWKLIRNGLLGSGSILLWDEPESNLNPELFPLVANLLLMLQQNDVQIFIATHSYNFAKYLELLRRHEKQVQFHNLFRREDIICGKSAFTMQELYPNHLFTADEQLLDLVYEEEVKGK